MKSSFAKSALGAALLALATVAVPAQELKIGYVNSDRVVRECAPAIAAQARLEAEFSKREKDLNDLGARLKTAADKFDKDQPTLSEAEKTKRQRDLVDQDRDIQRRRREFQEDLTKRKSDEMSTLVDRANTVVKQIFDNEKYDLILQDAAFFSPRVDITDKVIKALNAQSTK